MEGQVLGTAQPGDCSISDSWPTQSFEPAATNSTTPTCHPFIILQRHWRRITSTTTLGAPRLTDTLVGQPASAISNRHSTSITHTHTWETSTTSTATTLVINPRTSPLQHAHIHNSSTTMQRPLTHPDKPTRHIRQRWFPVTTHDHWPPHPLATPRRQNTFCRRECDTDAQAISRPRLCMVAHHALGFSPTDTQQTNAMATPVDTSSKLPPTTQPPHSRTPTTSTNQTTGRHPAVLLEDYLSIASQRKHQPTPNARRPHTAKVDKPTLEWLNIKDDSTYAQVREHIMNYMSVCQRAGLKSRYSKPFKTLQSLMVEDHHQWRWTEGQRQRQGQVQRRKRWTW